VRRAAVPGVDNDDFVIFFFGMNGAQVDVVRVRVKDIGEDTVGGDGDDGVAGGVVRNVD
jgi:hypothetical protein